MILGVTALCLFLLSGCNLMQWDTPEEAGWYIQLNINHPAKSISVSEYEVTGLTVEVFDPEQALIETIDWVPQDGSTSSPAPSEWST